MAVQPDVEYFARLVDALEPWLDKVVIIGGWAHRLYRLHPLAQPLDYEPLGTFDTDIAVPLDLPATGGQIRARLLERNFREELMGDMQPPAAHYRVETGARSTGVGARRCHPGSIGEESGGPKCAAHHQCVATACAASKGATRSDGFRWMGGQPRSIQRDAGRQFELPWRERLGAVSLSGQIEAAW